MDWQGLWQLLQPYFAGRIRHLLAALAGAMVAKHIIQPDQQSAFVDIGLSIAAYLAAEVWSVWAAKGIPWLMAEKARLEKLAAIYQKQAASQKTAAQRQAEMQADAAAAAPPLTQKS